MRQAARYCDAAAREMVGLQTTSGDVAFAAPAHIAVVRKS